MGGNAASLSRPGFLNNEAIPKRQQLQGFPSNQLMPLEKKLKNRN